MKTINRKYLLLAAAAVLLIFAGFSVYNRWGGPKAMTKKPAAVCGKAY
jgi:uncharacterized membrane protein YbhN (UPF0104 family)